MAIERRMDRSMFATEQLVLLKSHCFTPGKLFEPGKYFAGELPDTAFAMGLVEALPPVRGKNEQNPPQPEDSPADDSSADA